MRKVVFEGSRTESEDALRRLEEANIKGVLIPDDRPESQRSLFGDHIVKVGQKQYEDARALLVKMGF